MMQLFRRKSSATIRPSSTESTSSSPPSPSPSSSSQETIPSIPHRLFRRKSSANIRSSTDSTSSQETPPSPPRRLFRRKSSATIRPSTAAEATTTSTASSQNNPPSPTSPRPYTSAASPPPIPTQFLQPLPVQPALENPTITHLTATLSANPNRVSNRFSTTSTLFEREVPPPPPRPSPLAQIQQSPIEAYVTQARETDLQRLGYDAMMALAWVQAEERRRAATSRGWQHDPWRGGFGPSRPAERVRPAPVPALRVDTASAAPASSPRVEVQERVVQERSGNGLRERLGRRGLMKSQSIFNLKWRMRDVV
ncbi:uncharacterized protein LY89DRAFT_692528, partial [Mollisia scopiformis]